MKPAGPGLGSSNGLPLRTATTIRRIATVGIIVIGLAIAALAIRGWRVASLRRDALEAVRSAEWSKAERLLDGLEWYRVADGEFLRLRSRVLAESGDLARAAEALSHYNPAAADAADVFLRRGKLLMALYRASEAEAAFRTCLRIDPTSLEARRTLVLLLGIERRAEEQEAELRDQLRASDPASAIEALRLLAAGVPAIPADGLPRDTDEGQILTRIVAAEPGNRHALQALAYFLRNRGRLAEAKQSLDQWLSSHPDDLDARREWIACVLDEGDDTAARPFLETLPAAARSSARWWSLRGDWQTMRGRNDEAVLSYRESLRLAANDAKVRYKLGQALAASGRTENSDIELRWSEDAKALKKIARTIDESAPDFELVQSAVRLCRGMNRQFEAGAWEAVARNITRGRR